MRRIDCTDVVNGTVIGEISLTNHYTFHVTGKCVAYTDQLNDAAAIAWFKEKWPNHYKTGAEMRCYD